MQSSTTFLLTFLLISSSVFGATRTDPASEYKNIELISSSPEAVVLQCDLKDLNSTTIEQGGQQFSSHLLPDEATTYSPGRPVLPAVCRFVVVSPNSNLELVVTPSEPRLVNAELPPLLLEATPGMVMESLDDNSIYPPVVAEMGSPFIIRGVRMVKVTVYPIQYVSGTDSCSPHYLFYDRIITEIRSVGGEAVNPVTRSDLRVRNRTFNKLIQALAINGGEVGRDDPGRDNPDRPEGHYLIVTNTNCLRFIRPFIEWRRKAGYQVDILNLSDGDARSSNTVKTAIQARYDDYIDAGIDPFDEILLVGDRNTYAVGPQAVWMLEADPGVSNWGGQGNHADYLYACLEGDDEFLDVGISRWISGSQPTLELAVGKTLGYEANPYMENPEWFGRAAAFSQHWGHGEFNSWHPGQHLEVRWAAELLRHIGFEDIPFYERWEFDQNAQIIGPWLRDRVNERTNLMMGRAENNYWTNQLQGVNDNVVFPIYFTSAIHSDRPGTMLFREGDGQHLRGVVAECFTWGELSTDPSKLACNMIWAEMVSGFLAHDLPLGLARLYALTNFARDMPNIQYNQALIHPMMRTDFDVIGDPGLQPWLGTPRLVEAELLTGTEPTRRLFTVQVNDMEDEPVQDATVTFYAPGDLPADPNEFADYDGYKVKSTLSDADGRAFFLFDEADAFIEGTPLYITVTGRDIKPFFLQREFEIQAVAIELANFTLDEREGNGDEDPNPGETHFLTLQARNVGNRTLTGVTATVTSASPWVEVIEENRITFEDIGVGDEAFANQSVIIRLHRSCPDGSVHPESRPIIKIDFSFEGGQSETAIRLDPVAPAFVLSEIVGGDVIPDSVFEFDLFIHNIGRMDSPPLIASLQSLGLGVNVLAEESFFPAIRIDRRAQLNGDPFTIAGNRVVPPGTRHKVLLAVTSDEGWRDTVDFELQVRTPRESAPQGPDAYGYICFDDTDQDWDAAPEYEWIEINPAIENAEFEGVRLNLDGQVQNDIGEAQVIELPFQTQFYGELFDHITVASNGFIAMGEQPGVVNFQNFPLDRGIGGGAGMIAPLWTDLRIGENSRVLVCYDEDRGQYIIEWSRMQYPRHGDDIELTFQVILYDHDIWITETGDQDILFQYRQVEIISNIRVGDTEWGSGVPFPSVGISSPDCKTGVSYVWRNVYPVTNAEIQNRRAIKFATSFEYRACGLFGRVTDAETGNGIEGAIVFTGHGFFTETDEDGFWRILGALAEMEFSITFRKQGYNDSTVVVEGGVQEGDSLEINVSLLHPEFLLSDDDVRVMLANDQQFSQDLTITNSGNGPLDWTAEKRLIGDANADPWELRRSYNVSRITDDDRVEGVIFAQDKFFLSGANGIDSANMIYVLNRDGELINRLEQIGSSRYGYKDMEWDGNNIWAAGEDTIYCLTTEGQVVTSWDDPLNPSQYIAYNSEEGVLYLCGTTTATIVRCDLEGNVLEGALSRHSLRMYGLGYWPEDPDGYDLYIVNHPSGTPSFVTKMNVETGDTMTVIEIPQDSSSSGQQSAWITNEFDVYSWVFMSIQNISAVGGGDRVDIHQLSARKDWMDLSLWGGRVEAGEAQALTLSLDAADLPDTFFVGEMLFRHNADSGVAHLDIELTVGGDPILQPFDLLLPVNGDTIYEQRRHLPEVRFVWEPFIDPWREDTVTYVQWFTANGESAHYTVSDTFNLIGLDTLRRYILLEGPLMWWVTATVGQDTMYCREPFIINILPLSSDTDPTIPVEFGFESIHPIPFNSRTTIRFGVDQPEKTTLSVYDLLGRKVEVLFDKTPEVGYYSIAWDAGKLSSGIYVLRLEKAGRMELAKVALLR